MPKIFYCLKCSTAKYSHSTYCSSIKTEIYYYNSKGKSCEVDDLEMDERRTQIFKAHELVDLHRMPYCSWNRDYIRLRRVYIRKYNPAGWNAIGWYCPKCGNFIKN